MANRPGTKPPTVWIAIADGARARIVVHAAHERGYETIRSIESVTAHRSSAALGKARPGRVAERATGLRHAVEPRSDLHRQAKDAFAALVAETINRAAARGDFQGLVLVAPARQLAAIRRRLAAKVRTALAGTLAKDLTKVPDGDLPPHLAAVPSARLPTAA